MTKCDNEIAPDSARSSLDSARVERAGYFPSRRLDFDLLPHISAIAADFGMDLSRDGKRSKDRKIIFSQCGGYWHDFQTGESGGIVKLVCRLANCDRAEALSRLSRSYPAAIVRGPRASAPADRRNRSAAMSETKSRLDIFRACCSAVLTLAMIDIDDRLRPGGDLSVSAATGDKTKYFDRQAAIMARKRLSARIAEIDSLSVAELRILEAVMVARSTTGNSWRPSTDNPIDIFIRSDKPLADLLDVETDILAAADHPIKKTVLLFIAIQCAIAHGCDPVGIEYADKLSSSAGLFHRLFGLKR